MLDSCKLTFCTFKIVTFKIWISRFTFWIWEVTIHVSHTFTFWISRFRFKFNRGSKSQPLDRDFTTGSFRLWNVLLRQLTLLQIKSNFSFVTIFVGKFSFNFWLIFANHFTLVGYQNISHSINNLQIFPSWAEIIFEIGLDSI